MGDMARGVRDRPERASLDDIAPVSLPLMPAYPVDARVGNVRNNDAGLLDEISLAA